MTVNCQSNLKQQTNRVLKRIKGIRGLGRIFLIMSRWLSTGKARLQKKADSSILWCALIQYAKNSKMKISQEENLIKSYS